MKKQGIIISIVGSIIAAVGYGLYKGGRNLPPEKYTPEWIEALNDEEWATEREIVRQQYCNSAFSENAGALQKLLWLFDEIYRKKNHKDGEEYRGPAYSREHGYNLYKPED